MPVLPGLDLVPPMLAAAGTLPGDRAGVTSSSTTA
jgi:hypothetical protein